MTCSEMISYRIAFLPLLHHPSLMRGKLAEVIFYGFFNEGDSWTKSYFKVCSVMQYLMGAIGSKDHCCNHCHHRIRVV